MFIDEQLKMNLNGVPQYVSIRAQKKDAPLIPAVHARTASLTCLSGTFSLSIQCKTAKKSAARRSTPTRTAVIFFSFIAPLLSIYIPYRAQFLYKYELHPQFFPEDGSWSQSEYDRQ